MLLDNGDFYYALYFVVSTTKKHIKVFTYWQKFTRSYLYSCQFDAEICLEYFGMKIEAKYAFLNAKTHFFSFFFVPLCLSVSLL